MHIHYCLYVCAKQILRDRISGHVSGAVRASGQWNTAPGGLVALPEYTGNLPWQQRQDVDVGGPSPYTSFTALVYASGHSTSPYITSPLYRLLKSLAKTSYLRKVCVDGF